MAVPKAWKDGKAGKTPISAAALIDVEERQKAETQAEVAAEEVRAKAAEAGKATPAEVSAEKTRAEAAEAKKADLEEGKLKESELPSSVVTDSDVGSPGQVGKVLDAAKVMYLWPTDSRIANPIDLTGATYSDKGFAELLALAITKGLTIILPNGSEIKLEKSALIPTGVQFITVGSEAVATIRFPTDQGAPAYALTSGTIEIGATSLPLKYVTGGTFRAATPESPQQVYINRIGMVTYTGITGSGESITLTGVTGITKKISTLAYSVVQKCAIYVENSTAGRSTTFGPGIRIKGPSVGTEATWSTATPPESMDGVWLGNNCRIDCEVTGFRHCVAITADHQIIGQNYRGTSCYSCLAFLGPRMTLADQVVESGCLLTSAWWASVYVGDGSNLTNIKFDKAHFGAASCWAVWKEANRGLPASEQSSGFISTASLVFVDPSFESCQVGAIGCPDGLSTLQGATFINPTFSWASSNPSAPEPQAVIACKVDEMTVIGPPGISFWAAYKVGQKAMILSDSFLRSSRLEGFKTLIDKAIEKGIPIMKGVTGEEIQADIGFRHGRFFGRNAEAGILKGHVLSYFGTYSQKKIKRYEKIAGVAGIALADAFQKAVAIATNPVEPVTVKVKEQSNPPTAPAAAANATVGTLEAKTYFYKVAAVLSGGGLMAASAEVSATAELNKSVKVTWVAPAEIPHGQTITGYRVYRGVVAGEEKGYKAVGAVLEYMDSGAALTGTTTPPTKNTGCEIYGTGLVRPFGTTAPGCACIASGPGDATAPVFAQTYEEPDNGETAVVFITPALL